MAGARDRLAHVEGRFQEQTRMVDGIRETVAGLEERMGQRFDAVDRRFEATDAKISRQFYWMVGLQLTTLTAIVTALAAR